MEMHGRIVGMQLHSLNIVVVEMKNFGLVVVNPDDGMIEFVHVNSCILRMVLNRGGLARGESQLGLLEWSKYYSKVVPKIVPLSALTEIS